MRGHTNYDNETGMAGNVCSVSDRPGYCYCWWYQERCWTGLVACDYWWRLSGGRSADWWMVAGQQVIQALTSGAATGLECFCSGFPTWWKYQQATDPADQEPGHSRAVFQAVQHQVCSGLLVA